MNSVNGLIEKLGYSQAETFLRSEKYQEVPAFARQFRLAEKECGLQGVYVLRSSSTSKSVVPVLYVCQASNREEADKIHRLIWNQNIAPFAIVWTPSEVRLYSGFAYPKDDDSQSPKHLKNILRESVDHLELANRIIPSFGATSIDNGTIWERESKYVRPESRVDWRLLDNLKHLGDKLRVQMALPAYCAHALIGKYVYLRYLRDRRILSDERLRDFNISVDDVFSRNARSTKLEKLEKCLDEWLNGEVFQIPWGDGIEESHIREVAGAFFGDDAETGQLCLFNDFNFEHIPVETLSVVYEQFLHAEGKGKDAGAYYTPIHLIDFVLDAMEDIQPLEKGMRILDPSCGSGAFLVQAYRRLIEKELIGRQSDCLRPVELRNLLCEHIFGVDRDMDACKVTELSLILTLLDYVDPPDLRSSNRFKLPALRGRNIFGGESEDFFNEDSRFHQAFASKKADWIVGNPPWTETKFTSDYHFAREWKKRHNKEFPTGGNQLAELFLWKVGLHVKPDMAAIGLLVPAMTLFKSESKCFREQFFRRNRVDLVVNFANFAYVLFAGRVQVSCAALFYRPVTSEEALGTSILSFAPLVTNQETTRLRENDKRKDTWAITANASEVKEIRVEEACVGNSLTWKLAMWGSYRDQRLLDRVTHEFPTLSEFAKERSLVVSEGLPLRDKSCKESLKPLSEEDIVTALDYENLKKKSSIPIFRIPDEFIVEIPEETRAFRIRGGGQPLKVARPPHIFVSVNRKYSIYSDKAFHIPPTQVGISGGSENTEVLKALSLYILSDFSQYQQYMCSPQWGVSRSFANLSTLKTLPLPFNSNSQVVSTLADIHSKLIEIEKRYSGREYTIAMPVFSSFTVKIKNKESEMRHWFGKINDVVYNSLRLRSDERQVIEDFLKFRVHANKGQSGPKVAGPPSEKEIQAYMQILVQELDDFVRASGFFSHQIRALLNRRSGICILRLQRVKTNMNSSVAIEETDDKGISSLLVRLSKLTGRQYGQWLYFNRGMRIYAGKDVYLFKPLQRLYWLQSQAFLDADSLICDLVGGGA